MSAYLPVSFGSLVWLMCLLTVQLGAAFLFMNFCRSRNSRHFAWVFAMLSIFVAHSITAAEPPGLRMLGLIAASMLAMKSLVLIEHCHRSSASLPIFRFLGFTTLWLGMRPSLFMKSVKRFHDERSLAIYGITRIMGGALLFVVARWLYPSHAWTANVIALVGISLILHFGICTLLVVAWRLLGIPVQQLFRAPLRSVTLSEFWSQRWNFAFSEMTSQVVYRPLRERFGSGTALYSGFLLSGVLHEIAISLPVQSGYGLPTLYFVLQALGIQLERRIALPPTVRRLFTATVLILPLPMLFHWPFLNAVLIPLF